jgi:hypothetical protein
MTRTFNGHRITGRGRSGLVWTLSEGKTMRTVRVGVGVLAVALAFAQEERKAVETNSNDRRVDYIEFPATDVAKTKAFYVRVFGWQFTDYGPDYTSFEDGRLAGGFWKKDRVTGGGPLVVIYAVDLAGMEAKVRAAGGTIVRAMHSFPGGRRFHFTDPSGNELAVWSEK